MTIFEICMFLLLAPVMIFSMTLVRKLEDCLDAVNEILMEKRKGGDER